MGRLALHSGRSERHEPAEIWSEIRQIEKRLPQRALRQPGAARLCAYGNWTSVCGATLVIIINAAYGVTNVPDTRRAVGRLYGLTPIQIIYKVALPEAGPQIVVGMRTALSLAPVLTVVVELIVGTEGGIGKRIHDNEFLFNTPSMYVAILLTGAVGYVLNMGFAALERIVLHGRQVDSILVEASVARSDSGRLILRV